MFYVYILYSKNLNKRYVGFTGKNVKARLVEHKSGVVPFTSKTKDWEVIYYQGFISKSDAVAEERFLKSGKGRERLKFLLKDTMSIVDKYGGVPKWS